MGSNELSRKDQTSQSERKSTLNIHWKDWCWTSNTFSTWCKVLTLWRKLMLGKTEGRRRRGWQKMGWLDGIINSRVYMSLSKLQKIVKDRGAWHAAVHRVAKSHIWLSDWTTTKRTTKIFKWRKPWLVARRYVWDILSGSYKLLSSPFI